MIYNKSRSFFSQHFFTMLSAFLFLLFFFVAVLLQPLHSTYTQIMVDVNRNMIHKTSMYMDTILGQVDDAVDVIASDADVLNSTLIPQLDRYERNNGIVNKLSNTVQNHEYLASMLVYIPSHNLAFSSEYKIGSLDSVTHSAVVSAVQHDTSTRYLILDKPDGGKGFYYFFHFPKDMQYGMGMVITEIRIDAFVSALSNQSDSVDDGYLLLNDDRQVLLSTGASLPFDDLSGYVQEIAGEKEGYHPLTLDSTRRSFFHETSKKTGLTYIYHMETDQLSSVLNMLLPIFLSTLGLFVLISILVTFFVTRHLYKPLEHLLGVVLTDQMSGVNLLTGSEYHLIGSRFMDLIEQRDHMRGILNNAQTLGKETFYHSALAGREHSESEWAFFKDNLDLDQLNQNRYVVFMLQINQPPASDRYLEDQSRLIHLKQLVQQYCQPQESYVYSSFDHSTLVALLVFKPDSPQPAQEQSAASDIVHRIKDATHGSFSITAGVSALHTGTEEIRLAYEEAQEALRYKLYSRSNAAENEDTASEVEDAGELPDEAHAEIIHRIVNAIRSGDEAQMRNHLNTLYQAILESSPADSRHYAMYVLEKLLDSIAQMAITTGLNAQTVIGPEHKLYSDFGQLQSFEEHTLYVDEVCSRVIDEVCKEMARKVHKYVQTAKNYVDDHYEKSGITLKSTAEYVGVNSAYLSKLFKNECGESYIDYLNNYRIEKAKELLSNTHASVKEIGYMVGFSNVQTFIRTFKKKEGVTPGRYGNRI